MTPDLSHFLSAQDRAATYETAMAEVAAGRKVTHWMWFVYPQLRGLGSSPTARQFGLEDLDEARAYLAHPVLGERLRRAAAAAADVPTASAEDVFGPVDALKLRSCATLFRRAAPGEAVFQRVLDRYFGGAPDPRTEALLGPPGP